ncbi:MAG TPA: methyltransferase domain-containing protein [Allosphingosinicella sp.]|nr:methyltransferase domain-containing protein [Allosphingosinicella sp.]
MAETGEAYRFEAREACPACGAEGSTTIYSTPFDEGGIGTFVRDYYHIDPAVLREAPYELQLCPGCGLVFQHYVGRDALLTALYTDWVDEPEDPERDLDTYRAELQAIPESRDAHELMAASSYLGVPLNRMKTLDYGMGWAGWARIAASLGCDSFGSDLAEPRMVYAARHGVHTVTDEEIGGHQFHFINTDQVFEHVTRPLELARRLAAVLAPGGVLKVSVPSGERVETIVTALRSGAYRGERDAIMPVQPLEHVNCFRRASIETMAERVGLNSVRPGLRHGYAFLRRRGTIRPTRPRKALKELVRPWYQYRDPTNLYVWLRRPG